MTTQSSTVEYIDIEKLSPSEYNPRKIEKSKLNKLKESIKNDPQFFEMRPCLVNQRNGNGSYFVFAGNQRLEAAKEIGLKKIPCIITKLDSKTEKKYNLLDNQHSGQWDFNLLASGFDIETLKGIGFNAIELERVFNLKETNAPKEVFELPGNVKVKEGDLIELGRHKLLCGDSTNPENVKRLLGSDQPSLCLTDPPYSVNYKSRKISKKGSDQRSLLNQSYKDDMDADTICKAVFNNNPSRQIVMSYGTLNFPAMFRQLEMSDFKFVHQMIWKKSNSVFTIKAKRYASKYESVLWFVKKDQLAIRNIPNNATDIFEFDSKEDHSIHPTIKPFELWKTLMGNHSNRKDIVYDPFCGSGQTLLAAEVLDRSARVIEFSPYFCQVIIDRYNQFINKEN